MEFTGSSNPFAPQRPTGISVLSVLMFIGGITSVVLGALILALGDLIGAYYGDVVATSLYAFGIILAGIGTLNLFVAYGLWIGKGWAWILAIAFAIIGIASSVADSIVILASGGSGSILLAALPEVVILFYLTRSKVRGFFGRGLSYNPEIVMKYTENVMTHLASDPAESAKVVAAFDKAGQSGVVDYLKQQDPDLTIDEARASAFALTSSIQGVLPTGREGTADTSPSNKLHPQTATGTVGSAETDSSQETKKEKSWIERWLQR